MGHIKSRVWKKDEFREFIGILKEGQIKHWKNVAEAVGVSHDTIEYWRTLPEAQSAISLGIVNALEQMEASGKKDWRMWRDTANILALGLNPPQKVEGSLKVNPAKEILRAAGLLEGDNDGQADSDSQGTSDSQTQV